MKMKLQKYKLGEPLDVKRGVSLTGADKIKDCVVWIPDLEEQKRIASILSALDNKIALNREINQNLEAMAKQLYDYWFVQFDFPNEEGKPYKSSGGVMTKDGRTNRLLPKNWNVKIYYNYSFL